MKPFNMIFLVVGAGLLLFALYKTGVVKKVKEGVSMQGKEAVRGSLETATFGGGCFWCMQPAFDNTKGVAEVIAGYAGGTGENPTYQDYAQKGHVEVIQMSYDPKQVSYEALLDIYWKNINPTDATGQFSDKGKHYRSIIYYHTPEQHQVAEQSKQRLQDSGKFLQPIVTEVAPFTTFYPAEQYHQEYYKKHPERYQAYKVGSGREKFLKDTWGK